MEYPDIFFDSLLLQVVKLPDAGICVVMILQDRFTHNTMRYQKAFLFHRTGISQIQHLRFVGELPGRNIGLSSSPHW